MNKNKENLELPPKPMAPIGHALWDGATGTALGALWGKLVGGKIVNSNTTTLRFGAMTMGFTGLLNGYFIGKAVETKHELTVKNIKLQQQVNELIEDGRKHQGDKSFVQQLTEAVPEQESKTRS